MTLEKAFTEIYKNGIWNHQNETLSGRGSALDATIDIRHNLPILVEKFKISSILDAPCGDFNWMKEVLPNLNVNYTGADIVKNLIKINSKKYKSDKINFIHLDITQDALPDNDLIICRDCLFHLHPIDVVKFFINFSKSNIKYLLTSTHINQNNFNNISKLKAGNFKPIDLFSHPYNLTKDVLYRFDDYIPNHMPREMIMFDREQIINRYKEYL